MENNGLKKKWRNRLASLTPPPPKVTSCFHSSWSKSTNRSFKMSWPLQMRPFGAFVPLTVVGVYWHAFGLI